MRTIKLTIEYDGTNYCGWQIQPNGVSVQGVISSALRKMTGEKNHVIGASRTDAGVHALGQTAHFKTNTTIPPEGFMRGINSMIEKDISIIRAEEAKEGFHAQRDAASKLYRYIILNGDIPSALLRNRCWHIRETLSLKAMQKASKCLVGKHDFAAFKSSGSSAKDAVRRIGGIRINKQGSHCEEAFGRRSNPMPESGLLNSVRNDRIVYIDVEGDGFVYHMVRNIVGTLVLIGRGAKPPEYMRDVLSKRERKMAGVCAPAMGLYLISVRY